MSRRMLLVRLAGSTVCLSTYKRQPDSAPMHSSERHCAKLYSAICWSPSIDSTFSAFCACACLSLVQYWRDNQQSVPGLAGLG